MDWLSGLVDLLGLGYEVSKDQHLTGAQREANQFNAQQAQLSRDFSAQQAEIGRDWQENQYLKYNSPQALVGQYQNAGINPALMFGGSTPAASTSAPTASGVAASSVNPSGGNVVGMIGELMKLSLLGEQKRGLQLQNLGQQLQNEWNPEIWSSQLGINRSAIEKNEAEIKSILASTEGQKLLNEWNPKLWSSQLQSEQVSREAAIVGIAKTQQEIQNLIAQKGLIGAQKDLALSERDLKLLMQALTSAQTALVQRQDTSVTLDNWKKDWEYDFMTEHGLKPDQNLWSIAVQTIGKKSSELHNIFKNGFKPSSGSR